MSKSKTKSLKQKGVTMMVTSKNALQPFHQGKSPFPPVMKTFMKWAWKGSLVTSAGSATSQTFRLNSLYDPDFTGAGSQPRYFDTLCGATGGSAPYNNYRVLRTLFRVQILNPNSTAGTSGVGYVHVTDDAPVSDTAAYEEYFDTLNCVARSVSPNGSDNSIQVWEGEVRHSDLLGVEDIMDDENAAGVYNNNPANVDYLRVGYRPYDDSTATTVTVIAQFCYEVEFYSLNAAGSS